MAESARRKRRIFLIHWNVDEASQRAARIESWGYRVEADPPRNAGALRRVRNDPPDAFVVDLTRVPSQGRDVGIWLRTTKATRHVPLLFVAGEASKVSATRALLPDAVFTDWRSLRADLRRSLEGGPVVAPVIPRDNFAGYSGTPLPKKLGIKAGTAVGLLGAPEGLASLLDPLPEGVRLLRGRRGKRDLTLWFVRAAADLARGFPGIVPFAENAGLWIVWPKKTSRLAADVSENLVRSTGLANGLVDFKICAVDADWSGLRFTIKK